MVSCRISCLVIFLLYIGGITVRMFEFFGCDLPVKQYVII